MTSRLSTEFPPLSDALVTKWRDEVESATRAAIDVIVFRELYDAKEDHANLVSVETRSNPEVFARFEAASRVLAREHGRSEAEAWELMVVAACEEAEHSVAISENLMGISQTTPPINEYLKKLQARLSPRSAAENSDARQALAGVKAEIADSIKHLSSVGPKSANKV